MINIPTVEAVRYGYYLIKPISNSDDDFVMPDGDEGKLSLGEIIVSGEYFYSQAESFDLDFNQGDVVIFRETGVIKVKVAGELHYLVPHENVFLSGLLEENE